MINRFSDAKCWLSFQCRDSGSTARGERFDSVVKAIMEHEAYPSKIVAIGVNCVDPNHVTSLLKLANKFNCQDAWKNSVRFEKLPYVVYPNSGEKWDAESKSWSGIWVIFLVCILNSVIN